MLLIGRVPLGRAIHCKSSLVPRSGLFATIPHAGTASNNRLVNFYRLNPQLR